jgi:AraC family transcriptional regulator, regulatory protein of adaptative response / methylated-DNA-[protein]-cysteine methyltransferase
MPDMNQRAVSATQSRKLVGGTPVRTQACRILSAQWLETPIGAMLAIVDETGIRLLEFGDRKALPGEIARLRQRVGPICFGRSEVLEVLAEQLAHYFSGTRTSFAVSVVQFGTALQAAIWAALRQIPLGQTRSYGELADVAGRPAAARVVARANGANQVAIVVPCHRVIGADGSLVGYGGRIWRKRWLLEHERRVATTSTIK